MAAKVRITRAARRDVAAARDYYDQQAAGLGQQFIDRFEECVRLNCSTPTARQFVFGVYRRCLMRQFHYAVYYAYDGTTVTVRCVYHTSRDPAGWQRRLS